jgi:uncharacterized protein with PIN domain
MPDALQTADTGMKMRGFLCDEMLRGLGRWLRAAGYDTVIAAGTVRTVAILATANRALST